jgi:hypothetical protein
LYRQVSSERSADSKSLRSRRKFALRIFSSKKSLRGKKLLQKKRSGKIFREKANAIDEAAIPRYKLAQLSSTVDNCSLIHTPVSSSARLLSPPCCPFFLASSPAGSDHPDHP